MNKMITIPEYKKPERTFWREFQSDVRASWRRQENALDYVIFYASIIIGAVIVLVTRY